LCVGGRRKVTTIFKKVVKEGLMKHVIKTKEEIRKQMVKTQGKNVQSGGNKRFKWPEVGVLKRRVA
jgi:hypothetical protein